MDYEKKYNDAIKYLKAFLDGDCVTHSEIIADFPELAESEDERVRKEMIHFLKSEKAFQTIDLPVSERWIAYLEKQKEQKPTFPRPHKGDDNNPYDMGVSEAQDYAIKRGFGVPFNDGEVYVDERHMTQTIGNILRWADEHPKEQKPAEWGAEHLQRDVPSKDLSEGIEMEWDSFNKHLAEYDDGTDEVVWLNRNSFTDIAEYFYEVGIRAMKEQMMNEAVTALVNEGSGDFLTLSIGKDYKKIGRKFKGNDKIKIIIIKEG